MRSVALVVGMALVGSGAVGCSTSPFGSHSCFVRGTRIRTPAGMTPIEQLRVGDEVISFDTATLALVTRRVTALHTARVSRTRAITLADSGIVVTTTDSHPFWEAERREWVPAGELTVDATLAIRDDVTGRLVPARIASILVEEDVSGGGVRDVFNITVEGPEHNYLAEGIAVHNKSPPCFPPECNIDGVGPTTPPRGDVFVIQNGIGTSTPIDIHVAPIADGTVIDDVLFKQNATIGGRSIAERYFPRGGPGGTDLKLRSFEDHSTPGGSVTVVTQHDGMSSASLPNRQTLSRGIILDVGAQQRVLIVGARGGTITIGRSTSAASAFDITPSTTDTVVLPITAEEPFPICGALSSPPGGRARNLILPTALAPIAHLKKRFALDDREAGGCLVITATPVEADADAGVAATPFQIDICGAPSAWPYAKGDIVRLEPPARLASANSKDAIRLVREGDSKATELGHVLNRQWTEASERPISAVDVKVDDDATCTMREELASGVYPSCTPWSSNPSFEIVRSPTRTTSRRRSLAATSLARPTWSLRPPPAPASSALPSMSSRRTRRKERGAIHVPGSFLAGLGT